MVVHCVQPQKNVIMQDNKKGLTVTAVSMGDSTIITAFFNELPGLLVQGSSDEDVRLKLDSLLGSYIDRLNSAKNNIDIRKSQLA